ncbi:hypothetical protein ACNQFZ_08770 [Schinkia sp. CFF1]
MNMIYNNLVPNNLINTIPCFTTQNSDLIGLDNNFLKSQLLLSESNNNILRLARGEGRKKILDSIIGSPNIIFDWGQKSMHSYLENSEVREFLEPNKVSKELLFRFINLYEEELEYHYYRYPHQFRNSVNSQKVINTIQEAIKKTESFDDLQLIKEWLCFALHTSGNREFSKISPWVSTTMGNRRYDIAYRYGLGNLKNFKYKDRGTVNKKYIILDYWVPISEENDSYRNANYVRDKLKSMGIDWYKNKHNEVMVKYVLFPHQLIGYYYFENHGLKHYCFNHHYIEKWKKDMYFKIGDFLYIDQELVDFPSDNPYRLIYLKQGGNFSVFNRR